MKVFCSTCKNDTNHEVLKEHQTTFHDEPSGISGGTIWQIVACMGCETVSFRRATGTSEDYIDTEDGREYFENVTIFPSRNKDEIIAKNYYGASHEVREIYKETIDAYNSDLLILCGGGVRAIIESICNDVSIKDGPVLVEDGKTGLKKTIRKENLEARINGLHEIGLLTQKTAEILHEHRFLGNTALHEIEAPNKGILKTAIEIVEHILDNLYELNNKGGELLRMRIKKKK